MIEFYKSITVVPIGALTNSNKTVPIPLRIKPWDGNLAAYAKLGNLHILATAAPPKLVAWKLKEYNRETK